MKMRYRLVVVYGLAAILVFGLSYLFLHTTIVSRFDRFIEHSKKQTAEQLLQNIEELFLSYGSWEAIQPFIRPMLGPRIAGVSISDSEGNELLHIRKRHPQGAPQRRRMERFSGHGRFTAPGEGAAGMRFSALQLPFYVSGYGRADIVFIVPGDSPGMLEKIYLSGIRKTMLASGLISLAIFAALGFIIAGSIARPLEHIARAAMGVSEGRLGLRVPVAGDAELSSVGASFNVMAASLEAREQLQRTMSSDIAHELRTPVTVLKSHLEAIQEGVMQAGPDEIASLLEESNRLERIIDDLKAIWQLEEGLQTAVHHTIDLRQQLSLIEQRASSLLRSAGRELLVCIPEEPVLIKGTPEAIDRAVWNILMNALRYAEHTIRITLKKEDGIFLSIEDDGPGIPEDVLPRIFDRFFRADDSRNRSTGGAGLGLAIARQAVLFLGGTITVHTVEPHGCCFCISLPPA
jgi:two-component system, OmpR family, sensor histidine kinase BaeS